MNAIEAGERRVSVCRMWKTRVTAALSTAGLIVATVVAGCSASEPEPTKPTYTVEERRTGREIAAEACNLARDFPELMGAREAAALTMALMNENDRWTDYQFTRIAEVTGEETLRRCPALYNRK